MNKQLLQDALDFARANGLPSITVEGVTMQVPPIKAVQEVTESQVKEITQAESAFDHMTDEEIMYYSTPYFDEIQARKYAKFQADKEKEALNG